MNEQQGTRWFRFSLGRLIIATGVAGVLLGLFGPEYFRESKSDAYNWVPIVGPVTSGGPALGLEPPADDDVMRALQDVKPVARRMQVFRVERSHAKVVKEKIADYVDPSRLIPTLGKSQRHHAHYKCTIYCTETTWFGWFKINAEDSVEVVYVDHNHLHRLAVAKPTGSGPAP